MLDEIPSVSIDANIGDLPDFTFVGIETRGAAAALEARGVEIWLKTIFSTIFYKPFSKNQLRFWRLYWSILLRIREQLRLKKEGKEIPVQFQIKAWEWTLMLLWGRGLGKSTVLEVSSIMRAALLGFGYCLFVSNTQNQANEHIQNCRMLIGSEKHKLLEYYPGMEVNQNARFEGRRTKDAENIFITINGFVCRALGLDAEARGLKIGFQRPNDLNIDDIDGINDSPGVSLKKLNELTGSIFGSIHYEFATVKFGQNLITETSVANLIYTGQVDALAQRTIIDATDDGIGEVVNAFSYLNIRDYMEDGRLKHEIMPDSVPTWPGLDLQEAQKFLDLMGKARFLAEYQNAFEQFRMGKVYHEFDETRHIIGWSHFKLIFGSAYIPPHWKAKGAADFGYSEKSLSAWLFAAASPENTRLPSHYFFYRARTFQEDDAEIGLQAEALWEDFFPNPLTGKRHFEATQNFAEYPALLRALKRKPRCVEPLSKYVYNVQLDRYEPKELRHKKIEDTFPVDMTEEDKALHYVALAKQSFISQIVSITISHEKTGEQKTLARQYGLPCSKVKRFEKDAGVIEANYLLRGDYTKPHPFFPADEIVKDEHGNDTGFYLLGCPFVFFIVDDEQILTPENDDGMKTCREHLLSQRWSEEKLTETGYKIREPMKFKADYGDALRMWSVDFTMPESTPRTLREEVLRRVPDETREVIERRGQIIVSPEDQMKHQAALEHAQQQVQVEMGESPEPEEAEEFEGYVNNPMYDEAVPDYGLDEEDMKF